MGEHLEEVGCVKNERDGTSEVWAPLGSFLAPGGPTRCVGGSVRGNHARFQENVLNSSRKFHLDPKSTITLSV